MPNWTAEQKQAIELEGSNILVSAGAGSGKTAVLSERALRKVKEGINIDEILILTFTKAAAYEMMLRIRDKLQKNNLIDQVNRIDKAYITTFDSFALSIVMKYHDRLNLKKEVTIIDEHAITFLKGEILNQIFDDYYWNKDSKFLSLIADFSLRDDKELKQYILSISDKMDLKYDKEKFLNDYVKKFYDSKTVNKRVTEYENLLLEKIKQIEYSLKEIELSIDGEYYQKFSEVLTPLLNAHNYDEIKELVDIQLPRLPQGSDSIVKKQKDSIKKGIEELTEMCSFESREQMITDYYDTKNNIEVIIDIVQKLDIEIQKYKYKYNSFEFIDISKLAIQLVEKYADIRKELTEYFNEIMIDEYQDTSDLQEQFIRLIENNNVYMVGDMKQSIYRFRNANPQIFKQKYDMYAKRKDGIKIDLNKNFRSRKEVLDNINEFFDSIMDDNFGGANYRESHRMVFGNSSYLEEGLTSQNYNINILNYTVEKDSVYQKYTKDEIEAFTIAKDIKKKIISKYQVLDKNTGKLRDIQYSDFVILMDRSSKFTLYKKIFEYLQIPLTILKDENIMNQNEVYLINNILKLIECVENKEDSNRFRYCFVSIARSYLYSYTDQEIFHIVNHHLYFETEIIQKIQKIVQKISIMNLQEIVSTIIEEFPFAEKMITVGNIQTGLAVLDYFIELASNLQNLDYDYHRFILYLDYIIEKGKEIKIPISISDNNSCQIMTIHKSKGLEYPICYYCGLSLSFNISDLKEKILFDSDYGIIVPSFKNGYQDTFYKILLKKKYIREEISEKIRLFYVALTRCKEQMILVANLKEQENIYLEDFVPNTEREQYRSFLNMLESIHERIESYIVNIQLEELNLSHEYKILNTNKIFQEINNTPITVSEYQKEESIIIESSHFSKKVHELLSSDQKKNMQFGIRIHELLEQVDFKNPCLDFLNISEFERNAIQRFLEQPVLSNIKEAKILKEYEFYTLDKNNQEKHGIIDLMLEYEEYIDIIDYKLKGIEDPLYIEQLKGYQNYVEKKTNKRVQIYLYSILENHLKQI